MKSVITKRSQFVIDEASSQRLDRICLDLASKMGMAKVSRSEAVRQLIARYRLPARSVEQPTVETTEE